VREADRVAERDPDGEQERADQARDTDREQVQEVVRVPERDPRAQSEMATLAVGPRGAVRAAG
jgi:hypothetical protein